jgi:hypothetical protein
MPNKDGSSLKKPECGVTPPCCWPRGSRASWSSHLWRLIHAQSMVQRATPLQSASTTRAPEMADGWHGPPVRVLKMRTCEHGEAWPDTTTGETAKPSLGVGRLGGWWRKGTEDAPMADRGRGGERATANPTVSAVSSGRRISMSWVPGFQLQESTQDGCSGETLDVVKEPGRRNLGLRWSR